MFSSCALHTIKGLGGGHSRNKGGRAQGRAEAGPLIVPPPKSLHKSPWLIVDKELPLGILWRCHIC